MLAFLKSLFFPSVADVVASIQRKVDQLDSIAARKADEAYKLHTESRTLSERADGCLGEQRAALNVACKLSALISTDVTK